MGHTHKNYWFMLVCSLGQAMLHTGDDFQILEISYNKCLFLAHLTCPEGSVGEVPLDKVPQRLGWRILLHLGAVPPGLCGRREKREHHNGPFVTSTWKWHVTSTYISLVRTGPIVCPNTKWSRSAFFMCPEGEENIIFLELNSVGGDIRVNL